MRLFRQHPGLGPSPLIATWLFGVSNSGDVIALYILACAVIGFIATVMMTDYTGQDIGEEYDRAR